MGFVEADADYEVRTSEAIFPDDRGQTTSASELPLVLTSAEGQRIAERWLAEARVARDSARFTLPPSLMNVGAGDVIRLPDLHGDGLFRIDQSEQTDRQALEAVRIEPAIYEPQDVTEKTFGLRSFPPPVPVELMLMDLPLFTGDEDPVAPYVAASGVPWPGSVALYSSGQDAGYGLNRLLTSASMIGQTQTVLPKACAGLFDRGPALRVQLIRGDLQSVSVDQVLGGANLAVIGDGSAENWEVFQFADAEIVSEDTFEISMRLRGQAGSDGVTPSQWPEGSIFVLLDGQPQQIDLASSARGVTQHYRYGPGTRPLTDPSYQYRTDAFSGVGLRPYSVAHLRASPAGSDLDVTWIRRARMGGDSWDGEDVPLSESFERYAVRVFKDDVQVRQVSVSSPNWSYTSAMQSADGAGETRIDVAQVSDVYGEGPASSVTLVA
ncbi:phage tail protein [Octadecabacter sp. G9-8]|uniref:Phage tail protein n=1 Tax=Octadecabacter dasysiphoniae TaxID=2909341 RepID=A0ABS9CZJ5_9RHOB|nr:phage tail protein [Octadecabacter dasysiphoniae]